MFLTSALGLVNNCAGFLATVVVTGIPNSGSFTKEESSPLIKGEALF